MPRKDQKKEAKYLTANRDIQAGRLQQRAARHLMNCNLPGDVVHHLAQKLELLIAKLANIHAKLTSTRASTVMDDKEIQSSGIH